jgi:hypothetical protein
MAFYNPDPAMHQALVDLVQQLASEDRPGLADQLSITWIRYPQSLIDQASRLNNADEAPLAAAGAHWGGDRARYPASVVKLIYMVAAEAWLQRRLIEDDEELRRAMADMIRDSSNDATSLVMDLLSGTRSGPNLKAEELNRWSDQRRLVNDWLASLDWPEWQGCNACQKTWGDGPYGRERQFYGPQLENRNRLSTEFTARMLEAVIAGTLVSPRACDRMRQLLARSLDPAHRASDPENQVDGFLGEALPPKALLWSKAGWMSQARHDAAYVEAEGITPTLLVVFSESKKCAADARLLPTIASRLLNHPQPA